MHPLLTHDLAVAHVQDLRRGATPRTRTGAAAPTRRPVRPADASTGRLRLRVGASLVHAGQRLMGPEPAPRLSPTGRPGC